MAMIKTKSISIGFNSFSGQAFFDMLTAYDDYIRDYFFGLHHAIAGDVIDGNHEYNVLESCDTYDYPANLLFNNFSDDFQFKRDIQMIKEVTNLKHVTILNPMLAEVIRKEFPDLEIQLSVRFWDWGRFSKPICRLPELKSMGIDVINVSGSMSYNDIEFMNRVHELGMKIKYITNEGCIIRKDLNYEHLDGFSGKMCRTNPFSVSACYSECVNVTNRYPWMQLAANEIYKETLKYFPEIDIYKISGRHRYVDYLTRHLEYWTSDQPTNYIYTVYDRIDISDKYDVFLDWVEFKATKCIGNCAKCQKCKYFWNELTDKKSTDG